jgi:hypothetical protein
MPVGSRIIEQVAALLSETEPLETSSIAAAVDYCSARAIRYALAALIKSGRARRHGVVYFACTGASSKIKPAAPDGEAA